MHTQVGHYPEDQYLVAGIAIGRHSGSGYSVTSISSVYGTSMDGTASDDHVGDHFEGNRVGDRSAGAQPQGHRKGRVDQQDYLQADGKVAQRTEGPASVGEEG